MKVLVLLAAAGLLLSAVPASADENQQDDSVSENVPESPQSEESPSPSDAAKSELKEDDEDRSGRLLAQYTTKTKAMFATTTISLISTCFSATDTNGCKRRRKRNTIQSPAEIENEILDPVDISASQAAPWDSSNEYEANGGLAHKKGKSFTVWSTLFSTYTLTSTSFFQGTTVTISGVCTIAGLTSSCFG